MAIVTSRGKDIGIERKERGGERREESDDGIRVTGEICQVNRWEER